MKRTRNDGFTLVETLVVIVILGVLAGIAALAAGTFTSTSARSSCTNDYRSVEAALESYREQNGGFPTAGVNGIPAAATGDAIPWLIPTLLKDQPYVANRYQIYVPLGTNTVDVYSAGSSFDAPGVTLISGGTGGTVNDCTLVH